MCVNISLNNERYYHEIYSLITISYIIKKSTNRKYVKNKIVFSEFSLIQNLSGWPLWKLSQQAFVHCFLDSVIHSFIQQTFLER